MNNNCKTTLKLGLIIIIINMGSVAMATEKNAHEKRENLPERISHLLDMGHSESYEAAEEMASKSGIDDIVADFDKALDADLELDEKEHLISVLCSTQLPDGLRVEYDDFIDNQALVSLLVSVYEKEQVTRSYILPYLLLTKRGVYPDSFESFLIDAYKKEPENKNHGLLLGHCGGEKALQVLSERQNSNNSRISFLAKVASAKLGDEKAEEEIIEAYRETVNNEQTEFRSPKLGRLRFALSYIDSVETKLAFCDSVSSPIEYKTARDVLAADPWQNAWNTIKRCAENTGIQVPSIWDQKKAIRWWAVNRARVKQKLKSVHKERMSRGDSGYIDRIWKNID